MPLLAAEEVLETYANEQKKNWNGKSVDLLHVTIGYRNNPPKVEKPEKTSWESITSLVAKFFPKLVKREMLVTIDKKAVVEASKDEKLFKRIREKCQIDVVQEESFFIKPKKEEVATA